ELLQVGVVARGGEVVVDGAPLLGELVRRLELLQLAADLGSLPPVVVDRRVRHALLHLRVRALEIGDQLLEVRRHRDGQVSFASSVISGTPASAFETGQFSFAVCAAWSKASASMPGTLPATVSAIFVMPSPGWNVTVDEVRSSSGVLPACESACESAIAKQAACADAISSSGLVTPLAPSSERAGQLTVCSPIAPLVVFVIVPLPSIKLPCHVTSARRSVAIARSFSSLAGNVPPGTVAARQAATGSSARSGARRAREMLAPTIQKSASIVLICPALDGSAAVPTSVNAATATALQPSTRLPAPRASGATASR